MTRRSALTSSTLALGSLVLGIVIGATASGSLAISGAEAAQQRGGQPATAEPPAPCGPKAMLPENLARNVAPDSRCFEIRMYTVDRARDGVGQFKGGINEEISVKFPKDGVYGYKCLPHVGMGMVGVVQVGKATNKADAAAGAAKLPGLGKKKMVELLAQVK